MTGYPPEDTNIDRGDSRGQYRYSMVDIYVINNNTLVNNCLIIFHELLSICSTKSLNVRLLIKKRAKTSAILLATSAKFYFNWLARV